ncbi:DNA-binding domain-containing protein [bacterium]|nr:DNA-binding domain-containing protein [bacterium]
MRTSLQKTQNLIWRLLKEPEGVAKALKRKKISLPIKAGKKLTSVERLDIYANMYFFRIRDALMSDYKACYHVLGHDTFHNLITDYLQKNPSRYYSLRFTGEKLATFLKKHPLSKKHPYSSDLASLEWALLDSFDAADDKPLTMEDLKAYTPDSWANATLTTSPSVILIKSAWPLKMIYEAGIKKKKLGKIKKEETYICVWRQDFKVYYRTLSKTEAGLLNKLKKEITAGELSQKIAKTVKTDEAPQEIARYFKKWMQAGLILKQS